MPGNTSIGFVKLADQIGCGDNQIKTLVRDLATCLEVLPSHSWSDFMCTLSCVSLLTILLHTSHFKVTPAQRRIWKERRDSTEQGTAEAERMEAGHWAGHYTGYGFCDCDAWGVGGGLFLHFSSSKMWQQHFSGKPFITNQCHRF